MWKTIDAGNIHCQRFFQYEDGKVFTARFAKQALVSKKQGKAEQVAHRLESMVSAGVLIIDHLDVLHGHEVVVLGSNHGPNVADEATHDQGDDVSCIKFAVSIGIRFTKIPCDVCSQ